MSKLPSILSNKDMEGYVDNTIPHYKDKEITYWSMNVDKGNMYTTHSKGINVFAKTHGVTQPIDKSKSVLQFHQNIGNDRSARNVDYNTADNTFVDGFLEQKRINNV